MFLCSNVCTFRDRVHHGMLGNNHADKLYRTVPIFNKNYTRAEDTIDFPIAIGDNVDVFKCCSQIYVLNILLINWVNIYSFIKATGQKS